MTMAYDIATEAVIERLDADALHDGGAHFVIGYLAGTIESGGVITPDDWNMAMQAARQYADERKARAAALEAGRRDV